MAKHTKNALQIILMFFFFSFIGWIWEMGIHLVEDGQFVNRGVLHGPWLPIYGAGAAMIIILFRNHRDQNPIIQIILMMAVCGVVEYGTSVFLEWMYNGKRWWDYTGYFLNIHGRICFLSLIIFGVGGMVIVRLLLPEMERRMERINSRTLLLIVSVLVMVCVLDSAYSTVHPNAGSGITDYMAYLNE